MRKPALFLQNIRKPVSFSRSKLITSFTCCPATLLPGGTDGLSLLTNLQVLPSRGLGLALLHDQAAMGSRGAVSLPFLGPRPDMCAVTLTPLGHPAAARKHRSRVCVVPPNSASSPLRRCQRPHLSSLPKQQAQRGIRSVRSVRGQGVRPVSAEST